MRARNMDKEKLLYRFLFSCAVGYFLGSFIIRRRNITVDSNPLTKRMDFLDSKKTVYSAESSPQRLDLKPSAPKANLYIGLLSVGSNLDTRVAASRDTWMTRSGAVIEVYANNNQSLSDIKTIKLLGVDDNAYPPQKKSFSMLKYMHTAYVDKFDWFVRLDDDAYVDVDKLSMFLNRINSSQPRYIGSPGYGKGREDLLGDGDNYCMGGPGMVFSRALMRQLGPHLGECLQHMYTSHEDIEVGRCVQKYTGIKCTTSWETKKLFFQNYNSGTYTNNIKDITPKQLDEGKIFHANKDPAYQYRFHTMVLKRKIATILKRIAQAEKDIQIVTLQNGFSDDAGMNAHAQYRWSTIYNRDHYQADRSQPMKRMDPTLNHVLVEDTNTFIRVLQTRVNNEFAKLKEVDFVNTYYVVNPLHSMDAISLLECKFSTGPGKPRTTQHVSVHQRHRFTSATFLSEPIELCPTGCVRKDNEPTVLIKRPNETPVNFLTALSGRPENFIRFLNNFENSFLTRGEKVNLIVTYFPPEYEVDITTNSSKEIVEVDGISPNFGKKTPLGPDAKFVTENMNRLQNAYPESKIAVINLEPGTEFSRGFGLQIAAKSVESRDEIIFFCDVDLVFAPEILDHICRNTIRHKQVYYPVFFSQYDPDVVYVDMPKPQNYFVFSELAGFWRHFSYGMVSLYASDFDRTNGFDLSIHGWGLEDIHLVNAILTAGLDVFKSTEPGQVHVFHDKICDSSLSEKQRTSCQNSRAAHYAPSTLLYYLWKTPESNETIEEV
ncbi:chondroitin sulfate synthase 3-like [Ciona intestinalis]